MGLGFLALNIPYRLDLEKITAILLIFKYFLWLELAFKKGRNINSCKPWKVALDWMLVMVQKLQLMVVVDLTPGCRQPNFTVHLGPHVLRI